MIQTKSCELKGSKKFLVLAQSLGPWRTQVYETTLPSNPKQIITQLLWRSREIANFNHFTSWFYKSATNSKKYPLLSIVLEKEKELPMVRYISDILQWHAVLFTVYSPGSISREQVL